MAIDGRKIAKNTAALYFRMILLMIISLYTSRVVLAALGVDDYGIYNVVGGVVALLGFLNGTISTSSSRFITVALGTGDETGMRKTFTTVFTVCILLLTLIILVAETVGLVFLSEKMVIPTSRMNAAFWVYQFSVITVALNVISVPFNAAIIAHEKMDVFAYFSLFDGFAKLIAASILNITTIDRLVLWGTCLMLIQVVSSFLYSAYSLKKFNECTISLKCDKYKLRNIFSFMSWAAYGSLATAGFTQGLNIILNLFFGPVVNAARGIAVQVQGAVLHFTTNFQTAVNPQLIQNTANKDFPAARTILVSSSKLSFYLLCILGIPIISETHYILNLWLGQVPENTVSFVRIMLFISIWGCLANPLRIINQAEGNIRKFQICECTILLLIVPISYFSLKLWEIPILVFIVHFIMDSIAQIVRIKIVLPKVNMSVKSYITDVYLPIIPSFFIPLACHGLLNYWFEESFTRFICNFLCAELVIIICVLVFGLSKYEKEFIMNAFRKLLY